MRATVVVAAPDRFAATAASWIADTIHAVLDARGHCRLALSGGSTPIPVYQDLVGRAIPWRDVSIFFADERAVAAENRLSNYGAIRAALLESVPVPAGQIHRMRAEAIDRDAAAEEYDRLLAAPLDLLLLGAGPDGHTASLFPDSSALFETDRRVVNVPPPPAPIEPRVDRMTITPLVIAAAHHVGMLIAGAGKAPLVHALLDGPDRSTELPAQLARQGTWILDTPAASQLLPQD